MTAKTPITLPKIKRQIYHFIWAHPNCTRAQIVRSVYGETSHKLGKTVSAHISQINIMFNGTGLGIKAVREKDVDGRRVTYSVRGPKPAF